MFFFYLNLAEILFSLKENYMSLKVDICQNSSGSYQRLSSYPPHVDPFCQLCTRSFEMSYPMLRNLTIPTLIGYIVIFIMASFYGRKNVLVLDIQYCHSNFLKNYLGILQTSDTFGALANKRVVKEAELVCVEVWPQQLGKVLVHLSF